MYEQHVSSFEGEVYKQTTNLIHTLPLLIVSIESILKKTYMLERYVQSNQFYKEKKKQIINGVVLHIKREFTICSFTSELSNIYIDQFEK